MTCALAFFTHKVTFFCLICLLITSDIHAHSIHFRIRDPQMVGRGMRGRIAMGEIATAVPVKPDPNPPQTAEGKYFK